MRWESVNIMTRKGKEPMSDTGVDKIRWDHGSTKLFLNLLAKWKKNMGVMRWGKISEDFMKLSGYSCTPLKLKAKHDNMKRNWQLFNRLRCAETGFGWNSDTCKVEASDEWWNARIAENPDYKKFRNNGLPLRDEQDLLWGGNSATGEVCVAPSTPLDDGLGATFGEGCCTLQLPVQTDLEDIPEELSTGASKTITPMQESYSSGKRSRNDETSRKGKKRSASVGVQHSEWFQTMVGIVKSLNEQQRSLFAVKKEYYASKMEYYACKMEYYASKMEMKMNEKYVDTTYEKAVKALVDLDIGKSHPEVFYFGVKLFNINSQRQLFLALPERLRFNYLERQFKKTGADAPLG
ncbi:uncharacterized protein LOC119981992 [Tripterygium wilfordii]|uniref:uncharacterized protein LOC119981992 n=1 Tax=Tripterygium wilfordii TaxID=458696 RepID=UPI0018F81A56|nr:uncharacterized protein LOC119981992 [Tripterygium wilfordii]